jgi:hypothetical protein
MSTRAIPAFIKPITRIRIPSPPYGLRIAVIPDCQVHPGVPIDHLVWCGKYLALKKPDVIIQLGDFTDLPSLSTHNSAGSLQLEGTRYKQDISYSKFAMGKFVNELHKVSGWNPYMYLTLGNHEHRIIRAVEADPKLEGTISLEDLEYEKFGWKVYPFLQPIVAGGVCFCLTPDHKVLTSDLRYVPLGDISIGDSLLAFDEEGPYRTYRTSIVEQVDRDTAPVFAVTMRSGKVFKVTADHKWLTSQAATQQWTATCDLRTGTPVPKFFNEWVTDNSYSAGWLAGMLDGEGWLSKPNSRQGEIQIGIVQNEGILLDKIISELTIRSILHTVHYFTRCKAVRIGGPSSSKLQLLGELRPQRLLNKFKPEMLGRLNTLEIDYVENICPIGNKEIVLIKTSSNTLIAEGYGHHNCHYFPSGVMGRPITSAKALLAKLHMSCIAGHQQGRDIAFAKRADGVDMTALITGSFYQHAESYLSPYTNNHWRGFVMMHSVKDGSFDEMMVSVEYLKRRFGK